MVEGQLPGAMGSYRQQPALIQEAAILQTKECQHHRSWQGGRPVLVTTPLIHHCTCRSREKSISVSTSSSERKGSAEGWRGSVTSRFLAAIDSQGHGRGQNKAICSVTNESWE